MNKNFTIPKPKSGTSADVLDANSVACQAVRNGELFVEEEANIIW